MADIRVRVVRFGSGERLPVLLNGQGQPMFEPTLFVVTELRMRNLASNTIANALRAIQLFVTFLEAIGVDLPSRFAAGQTLHLHEIEDLAQACRRPVGALFPAEAVVGAPSTVPRRVAPLERARSRPEPVGEQVVSPAVMATRLQCIRDYVRWLVEVQLAHAPGSLVQRSELRAAADSLAQGLEARMPGGKSSSEREGIDLETRERLLAVTRPDSSENPWTEEHARHRNALMVDWLLHLGLRRGELLNVRVDDIDFRRGVVTVVRRPDAADDPRRNQPSVKTRGRDIPLSSGLLDATRRYILDFRAGLPLARTHGYLLVASGTGAPLSMPTVAKAFTVLRSKVQALPPDLSPHVLRHTWNDRFSEEMDQKKVPEETERKARSYLMGWSETSGTAATYTRRHVREKARRISLDLQENMLGGRGKS